MFVIKEIIMVSKQIVCPVSTSTREDRECQSQDHASQPLCAIVDCRSQNVDTHSPGGSIAHIMIWQDEHPDDDGDDDDIHDPSRKAGYSRVGIPLTELSLSYRVGKGNRTE